MMRRLIGVVLLAALLGPAALAHRIDEYLQATLLSIEPDGVRASVRLIPGILVAPSVIAAIDANGDGVFSEGEQRAYAQRVLAELSVKVDGVAAWPALASWSFPQPAQLRDGLGEIHIEYVVPLQRGGGNRSLTIENRHLRDRSVYLVNVVAPQDVSTRIVAQRRNRQQSAYELDFERAGQVSRASALRAWWNNLELAGLFHLGMRHIAQGTDHLLFLLVLLLPAPLVAVAGRWSGTASVRASLLHILGIVTAFTVGHSVTLTLAALGLVHLPGRPVEVFIAVSILVSAVHALRPIFPGREALIAGSFGLVHGLAFATTLDRLGLAGWSRAAGILAFNAGIEAMQMLVVAAVLPSLLLMRGTRAYPVLRIAGASLAGAAAVAWTVERLCNVATPINDAAETAARHAPAAALLLFIVSLACRLLLPHASPGRAEMALSRRAGGIGQ